VDHGDSATGVSRIVGVSAWANSIRQEILNVATYPSSVLITGPSGTGKELIAQAIHSHSHRAHKPFVAVDCAAVSGPLFASHMFGHVKGAFTGASHTTPGCFRAADGGTVLLDEIGDLEPEFQAKLLRVLQQRTVTPLGSHEEIPFDVRIIAATNCDLGEAVSTGRFREDLFYRLNVISLKTVALRDRPEDIEALAVHFLTQLAARSGTPRRRLARSCLEDMRSYDWPGNIRELENFLERAALAATGTEICPRALVHLWEGPHTTATRHCEQSSPAVPLVVFPSPARSASAAAALDPSGPWPTLADLEREHIHRTLQRTGYNQTAAAELLGIPRKQLARKIKKYAIDAAHFRRGRPHK
jgi:DNA-binding NtrC family response regulator